MLFITKECEDYSYIYLYIIFGPLAVIFLIETKHSYSKFHKKLKIQFTLGHLQNYPQASFNVHLQKLHGFSFNSELCDLAEKYGALTFIDECHATGFLGDTGR